jgi:hypothetical protein
MNKKECVLFTRALFWMAAARWAVAALGGTRRWLPSLSAHLCKCQMWKEKGKESNFKSNTFRWVQSSWKRRKRPSHLGGKRNQYLNKTRNPPPNSTFRHVLAVAKIVCVLCVCVLGVGPTINTRRLFFLFFFFSLMTTNHGKPTC